MLFVTETASAWEISTNIGVWCGTNLFVGLVQDGLSTASPPYEGPEPAETDYDENEEEPEYEDNEEYPDQNGNQAEQ